LAENASETKVLVVIEPGHFYQQSRRFTESGFIKVVVHRITEEGGPTATFFLIKIQYPTTGILNFLLDIRQPLFPPELGFFPLTITAIESKIAKIILSY